MCGEFMSTQGVCEAGRGPTLLDLTEIYDTSVDVISMLFLIGSVGSLFGAFMSKFLKCFEISPQCL